MIKKWKIFSLIASLFFLVGSAHAEMENMPTGENTDAYYIRLTLNNQNRYAITQLKVMADNDPMFEGTVRTGEVTKFPVNIFGKNGLYVTGRKEGCAPRDINIY